jgi:hypothetical protein
MAAYTYIPESVVATLLHSVEEEGAEVCVQVLP